MSAPSAAPDVVPSGLVGAIVGGPTPDERGWITFDVEVAGEIVVGVANPCGFGLRGGFGGVRPELANAVMLAVSRFVEENTDQMLALHREAARLRRAAGNPPLAGNTLRGKIQISESGMRRCNGGAAFITHGAAAPIAIMLFIGGGWIDHADDWESVSEQDRDEAFAVCLDHVFAHPDQAATLGLDVGLLDELWR